MTDTLPDSLVLPLAELQALWHHGTGDHQALASAGALRAPVLGHGAITLQSVGWRVQALVGRLSKTPLADAWTPPDPLQGPREGVCLVALTPSAAQWPMPRLSSAEDWVRQHAAAWRLTSRALRPALALLWVAQDGNGFLGWRSGTGEWSSMESLELPGSGLRRVRMTPARSLALVGSAPSSPDTEDHGRPSSLPDLLERTPDQDPDLDRYSRQRLALGATVLHTLQTRTTVLIGLGRTGSPLVHSTVRLGMPVLGLDPDVIEPHNLDGDFSPLHEGWTKAAALRKQLTPLARPGAAPDLRALDVASPAAGALIAATDGAIVTCVDNSRALVWANAWALALNRVHIVIASGLSGPGGLAEAEIRVLLPSEGCVVCAGGLAESLARVRERLTEPSTDGRAPRAGRFDAERPGSLRSWSVLAGHHGLRALEQVVAGRVRHSLFRRLTEQDDGGLRVEERAVLRQAGGARCRVCEQLGGGGLRAVSAERLRQLMDDTSLPT